MCIKFHLSHICFTLMLFIIFRVRASFNWQKMMWLHSSSHLMVLLSDTKILHICPFNGYRIDHFFRILLRTMYSLSSKMFTQINFGFEALIFFRKSHMHLLFCRYFF
jgi:hypothetical protein